jgi:hypothetical protein
MGLAFSSLFYLPAAIYCLFLIIASIFIGKSPREFILLLAIIPTMHFAWGAGFITSTKALR